MNRRVLALVMVLVLAAAATVVLANGMRYGTGPAAPRATVPGQRGMCHRGMRLQMLIRELNLTPDQVTQIRQIQQNFLTTTKPIRDQLHAKKQQMIQLWMADQPDTAAIKSVAAEIHALMGQLIDPGIDALAAAHRVLTPDQRVKLRTLIQTHAGRCMDMGAGLSE